MMTDHREYDSAFFTWEWVNILLINVRTSKVATVYLIYDHLIIVKVLFLTTLDIQICRNKISLQPQNQFRFYIV